MTQGVNDMSWLSCDKHDVANTERNAYNKQVTT